MTLRELIMRKVTLNVPWAIVWIEVKAGYGAYWILEIRSALGV